MVRALAPFAKKLLALLIMSFGDVPLLTLIGFNHVMLWKQISDGPFVITLFAPHGTRQATRPGTEIPAGGWFRVGALWLCLSMAGRRAPRSSQQRRGGFAPAVPS